MKLNKASAVSIYFVFFFSSCAFAGFKTGNGGHVLECATSQFYNQRLFLYDLYEGEIRHHKRMVFSSEKNALEKVEDLLNRVQKVDSERVLRYRNWLHQFSKESQFLENTELLSSDDIDIGFYPKDCALKQVITQQQPLFPGDKRYLIDKATWSNLNEDHKAGLILHELIYREALQEENKHLNSVKIRFFNYIFHTFENDHEWPFDQWFLILQAADLSFGTYSGVNIKVFDWHFNVTKGILEKRYPNIEFYPTGELKTAELSSNLGLDIAGEQFHMSYPKGIYTKVGSVEFFKNGKIHKISFNGDLNFKVQELKMGQFYEINDLTLNEVGKITSARGQNGIHLQDPDIRITEILY